LLLHDVRKDVKDFRPLLSFRGEDLFDLAGNAERGASLDVTAPFQPDAYRSGIENISELVQIDSAKAGTQNSCRAERVNRVHDAPNQPSSPAVRVEAAGQPPDDSAYQRENGAADPLRNGLTQCPAQARRDGTRQRLTQRRGVEQLPADPPDRRADAIAAESSANESAGNAGCT